MTPRHALAAALLAFACTTTAVAGSDPASDKPVGERADAQAQRIGGDTAKYLEELDSTIALAKKGTYGKLPRGASESLDDARHAIGELLANGADPRQLPPEQRIALFNAHQSIASIIKKDDKSRVVCTREQEIGSRVTTTKCLTIGEREEQAKMAQRGTESMQRNVCTPGPGNACTK